MKVNKIAILLITNLKILNMKKITLLLFFFSFTVTFAQDPGSCPEGEIADCFGNCAPASWLGDGYCDDGSYSYNGVDIYFDCAELEYDLGDCPIPEPAVLTGSVVEDPPLAFGQDADPEGPLTLTSVINIEEDIVIADVNVTVNINHAWNSDVKVSLASPAGTTVILIDGVGGSSDNFIETLLDDSALEAISSGEGPFTGSYIPSNPLSTFNGEMSLGDWTLTIEDTYPSLDDGGFIGWSIEIVEVGLSNSEYSIEEMITLYPNPTSDYIYISGLLEAQKYEIHNILGAKVLEGNISTNERISVEEFSNGIYILTLENGSSFKVLKK